MEIQSEFVTEKPMPQPAKIACIGEVMIELVARPDGEAKIGVAGDTYNTAVYLKKLASHRPIGVSYITALGTDSFSKRIFSDMAQHGIDTSCVEWRENHMPGLYAIETDDQGERSFSYWRGQSAAKTLFQEPCEIRPDAISAFDLVYVSGISMAILPPETRATLIDYLREYKDAGGKVAFDSNYRPRLWESVETAREVTMKMWSLSDIALPSLDDEMLLFGDSNEETVLQRLVHAGVSYGALKRGMDGPTPIGKTVSMTCYEKVTNIVDTTAAGDSFNAGFLSACISGCDLEKAMTQGHELASRVIQASGAIISLEQN